jgi:hypothetical protein
MRYFLHIRTDDTLLVDDEGDDFATLENACDHALRVASELGREYPPDSGTVVKLIEIEMTDGAGRLLMRLPIHSFVH